MTSNGFKSSDQSYQMESNSELKKTANSEDNGSYNWQDEYINDTINGAKLNAPHRDCEVVIEADDDTDFCRDRLSNPPKDNLYYSVFSMILCFALGLTAVQSSIQCRKAIAVRDRALADAKSEEARGRASLAVLAGITGWLCVASFIVLGVLS